MAVLWKTPASHVVLTTFCWAYAIKIFKWKLSLRH